MASSVDLTLPAPPPRPLSLSLSLSLFRLICISDWSNRRYFLFVLTMFLMLFVVESLAQLVGVLIKVRPIYNLVCARMPLIRASLSCQAI